MKTKVIWLRPGQHQFEIALKAKEKQLILVLGWLKKKDQVQAQITIRHQAPQSQAQVIIRAGG